MSSHPHPDSAPDPAPAPQRAQTRDARFAVFGLNLLVRMVAHPPVDKVVHCPKGGHILYGDVIAHGDGFDPDSKSFRPMPEPGSLVTFEEGMETVGGHSFYIEEQEYRIIHADALLVGFSPD
jgi:hypothetical protein